MQTLSFLVQVVISDEAEEADVHSYIGEAVTGWVGGNPDVDDPLHTIDQVRVDAVDVHIKRR